MSFLVDTCALSELFRPSPNPGVTVWFENTPGDLLHVSVLTFGEIRKGVTALPDGRRRARILTWLESELPAWFEDRVLAVDLRVADEWGRLLANATRVIPAIDGLIAATALRHRLTVVTRNTRDFDGAGVELLNPWDNAR